jgi:hypothetical protein
VRVNHLLLFFTGECAGVSGKVPEKFIDKLSGYLIKNKVLMQRLSSAPLAGVMNTSFIPAPSAGV